MAEPPSPTDLEFLERACALQVEVRELLDSMLADRDAARKARELPHDTSPDAERRRSIGRFQLSGSDTSLLVDTTTGQTWRLVGGDWVALPPPAGL